MSIKKGLFGKCEGYDKKCSNKASNKIELKNVIIDGLNVTAKYCDSCLSHLIIDTHLELKEKS